MHGAVSMMLGAAWLQEELAVQFISQQVLFSPFWGTLD